MAKVHWSGIAAIISYSLWLAGPALISFSEYVSYRVDSGGSVLPMNLGWMIPIVHLGSLVFGILYGLSLSSPKTGAWLVFGLSQILMFVPYLAIMTLNFKPVSVGMPFLWVIMAAVLLSSPGKDVSIHPLPRILLVVGSGLCVGFCISFFYLQSLEGHIVALVAQIIGALLIIWALIALKEEKRTSMEEETQWLVSDSSVTPYYG